MRLIFDAHLDLAWNALSFDRDLTLPVEEIRRRERGMTDQPSRGHSTVSLAELRRAGVAVCVATLLARSGRDNRAKPISLRTDLDYATPMIAHAAAHGQLAYYQSLERAGLICILRSRSDLRKHWNDYATNPDSAPLGVILAMEGADPITQPEELSHWRELGLRVLGLSHYGKGQYAYGTGVDGPLDPRGSGLLRQMRSHGIVLDVTHLSDMCFWQALDEFNGPLLASHHNCRSLVPGDRQLSDEQIKAVVKRDGIIGVALDAWMLYPGWKRQQSLPEVVGLSAAADHIEHVAQLACSTRHSAIGSDLDGGFGREQTPRDLDTIADLQKLGEILASRGYRDVDLDGIFHGNALRFFSNSLPE